MNTTECVDFINTTFDMHLSLTIAFSVNAFSALTLLVGRGYLSGARCRLAPSANLMPLALTVSCFSKIRIGFTLLVLPFYLSPG